MAPSLSERPLSLQARSSFSMAADSSGFQPDNPNWWMPTTSAPRGSFQEFIFLASTLFASQWAPPTVSSTLMNLFKSMSVSKAFKPGSID